MSVTTVPETTVPDGPAPQPQKSRKPLAVAVAVAAAAAAVAVAGFAGAFSSGPQTAAQIVASNGYTVVQTVTAASMPSSLAPYATSAAYGVSGSSVEAVVVFKSADASLVSVLVPVLQSDLPGLTVAANGNDLTITGPVSQFTEDGGLTG